MNFKGKVINKLDKSGVSKKDNTPFKSFQYVIEEQEGQYPQKGVFESFGDKVPELEEGDIVSIEYNHRANEWEGKFYGTCQIWRVEKEPGQATPPPPVDFGTEKTDDLPF